MSSSSVATRTTAGSGSNFYHQEDGAAGQVGNFPELADLVAADLYAATALWRLPKALRFAYACMLHVGSLGSWHPRCLFAGTHQRANQRGREPHRLDDVVPMVLGYDPLFQFVHEADLVSGLSLAVEKRPRGVFNLAGPPPLPLSVIARQVGRRPLPLPEPLLRAMLGRFGLPSSRRGALEHIKYPITVDDAAFRTATGYEPAHGAPETLREFRACFP